MSSSNNDLSPSSATRKRIVATTRTATNGESLPEKSKEPASTPNPKVIPYQRRKKHLSRSEQPRWQAVLNVATKLCLFFAGITWIWQMMKMSSGDSLGSYSGLGFDGRISEFENYVKKSVKMLQTQVENIDKKLKSEIGSVSKEMSKMIEEQGIILDRKIKHLDLKNDELGNSIAELRNMGFLTKNEFESFKNEFLKKRGANIKDASLDDIGAFAREIVEKEIEKHAADGIGRVDYALGAAGAQVIMHSEPHSSGKNNNWFDKNSRVHANAKKMLEPSFGEPGQCFALQGSNGFVDVRLRAGIVPEAVTLEHVAESVAYDRSSAPKDCVLSALFKGPEDAEYTPQILTKLTYDLTKSNVQTFNIESTDIGIVNMMRFEFTSNHGNPSLTCIYRLRVHGYETKTADAEDAI